MKSRIASHLSIFMENKPGKLERVSKVLAEAGINVRAFSVASAGEYGVCKMLVDSPKKAAEVLESVNITVTCKDILAVAVDDRPGGLHGLLSAISGQDINIEDSYGFVVEDKKSAIIILEAANPEAAGSKLAESGYRLLTQKELYALP